MPVNSIIIIDNIDELEAIESVYPELTSARLILLSTNFSFESIKGFSDRGYKHVDDTISDSEANDLSIEIYRLLWEWFIDEHNQDISKIDQCSLGAVFSGSLQILFTTIYRYIFGLKKLIKSSNKVYYSSQTEDIFLDVIVYLQTIIGFTIIPVEAGYKCTDTVYGKNLILDAGGRKRDLTPIFNWKPGIKNTLTSFVLKQQQSKCRNEKRVMLITAGKMDEYIAHIKRAGSAAYRWILPALSSKDVFQSVINGDKFPLFYHFPSVSSPPTEITNNLVDRLKQNIVEKVTQIDSELLVLVMERYLFSYFSGALQYYNNVINSLESLKPDLVIVGAESETHFIVAQAAKNKGIKTALLPHGIDIFGFEEVKRGIHKCIDYCFAYGNEDVEFFRMQGVSDNNIIKTFHPWFSKFIPPRANRNKTYRSALILAYEYYSHSIYDKYRSEMNYLEMVVSTLLELSILPRFIKIRGSYVMENQGGNRDSVTICNQSIPIVQGYGNLEDYLGQVDIVIGPISTAMIESGLSGKDYYAYHNYRYLDLMENGHPSIYHYANISYSMKQLKENIQQKQPYKQGCSVNDLMDLEGVESNEDLYLKFESGIQSVLDNLATTAGATILRGD